METKETKENKMNEWYQIYYRSDPKEQFEFCPCVYFKVFDRYDKPEDVMKALAKVRKAFPTIEFKVYHTEEV